MGKVVREGEIQIIDAGRSSSNSCIHQKICIRFRPILGRLSQALSQDSGCTKFARFVVHDEYISMPRRIRSPRAEFPSMYLALTLSGHVICPTE